jgi:hypothetical protein
MIGQSPMASQIQAAMSAHIAEHLGFAYRNRIEQAMGFDLPMPDEDMAPEVEVQLSRLIAKAAPMVLQESQNQVAMQEAQAQAQEAAADPLVQLQQQEIQITAQEVQRKAQKDAADIELEKMRLELEAAKIESTERMAGAQLGLKSAQAKAELEAKQEMEGARIGVDIAKNKQRPK